MKNMFLSIMLFILLLFNIIKAEEIKSDDSTFTEILMLLDNVYFSSTEWGDYDNDGDLDILITGFATGGRISKVYNNNNYTFTNINAELTGVIYGSGTWGDFDNDGDLDILITGNNGTALIAKLYRNDNGTFTDINAALTGVYNSSGSWGDYDNDGDLDIMLTGFASGGRISKVYNNRYGIFTDINAGLTGVSNGKGTWGDYDNDNDLDILITGHDGTSSTSKLYRNDKGIFTDTNAGLTGVSNCSAEWGDYDNDGDLDILITGLTAGGRISIIYSNNNGVFADITAGLTGVYNSSAVWGDYDIDGDLDILLTGNSMAGRTTKIYRNDSGIFTDIDALLENLEKGTSSWGDYDNDGDLDILITGTFGSGGATRIYRNNSNIKNTPPDPPANLSYVLNKNNSVTLSWQKSSDNETPQSGLSYNLYIGISPLKGNVKNPMSDISSGYRKVVKFGNTNHKNSYTLNNLDNARYYWAVQAVDHAFAGSDFSEEGTFLAPFTHISTSLPEVHNGSVSWGDHDNDGDLDVLVTGIDEYSLARSQIFSNLGNGNFVFYTGLTPLYNGSSAWGDYDNDGDLDILITGCASDGEISKVYNNNNGVFTDIIAGLTGVFDSSSEWGDYDNDGDLDILITGKSGLDNITKIYRNNNGVFADINAGLTAVQSSSAAWGDYDNDGDLDILITGFNGSNATSKIYNNNNGAFTDIDAGLIGVCDGSCEWGDYDSDGDLDILINGHTGIFFTSNIYRNDSGEFTDIDAGLIGQYHGKASWGDYDNDGDLDILLTSVVYSKIYNNIAGEFIETNTSLIGAFNNSAAWGDYDNDGDLDILITGSKNGNDSSSVSIIYRNNSEIPNTPPNPPAHLSCTQNENTTSVTFSWDKASDNETLWMGLSYNIYISTSPLIGNVKNSMSDPNSGFRKVVRIGNAYSKYSSMFGKYYYTINNLEGGKYYWSVQAVDNTFAGSEFSEECSFSLLFSDIIAGLKGVDGSSAWGDYDNDGDLDILITGFDGSKATSKVYNNNNGILTDINAALTGVYNDSSVEWGDYDNDGDLDILITGSSSNGRISKVYNNNNGMFVDTNAGLTGVYLSSANWGDYDNDGDLDILITGHDGTTGRSKIYRNDNGAFTDINAGLPGLYHSSAAWGDYDNDGDLDILITGYNGSNGSSKVYRNNNGVFSDINAFLYYVYNASASWGDYDNDGDLDILITGVNASGRITTIYNNDNGVFSVINMELSSNFNRSAWGDYDNDGDLDILLTSGAISMIYENNSGSFTETDVRLPGTDNQSSPVWGDYDNDGDLDILLTGSSGVNYISRIYRNNIEIPNTPPNPPADLNYILNGDKSVTLSWEKSSDAQTPQNGLSYNLYISTTPLNGDVKNPMSDISSGYRKVVSLGNINQLNSWTVKGLQDGSYYWGVQAVDHSFSGSAFSEFTFSTEIPDTLGIPGNISISHSSGNIVLNWDSVTGASSYRIFASADPFGIYSDVSAQGTFDTTSWSQPANVNMLFYYVTAVAGTKKCIKIQNEEEK